MTETAADLLIIEDDPAYREILSRTLNRHGYRVHAAATPGEALTQAKATPPHHVILDLNLAGESGLNLIQPLLAIEAKANIVVLTGYASIPTAVEAIKLGAAQYLAKPAGTHTILQALVGTTQPVDTAPDELPTVQSLEWEYIQRTLRENAGNITATARALKMHRRTLQRKLAKKRPTHSA